MSLNLLNPLLSLCKTLWVTFVKIRFILQVGSNNESDEKHHVHHQGWVLSNYHDHTQKVIQTLSFYWVFGHLLNVSWILSISSSDVCLLFAVWYAQWVWAVWVFFSVLLVVKVKKEEKNISVNIKTAELSSFWKSMLPKRSDAPARHRLTQLTILT